MNVDKTTLNQLLSSMKNYNATANAFSEDVAKGLMAVGFIILAILWYMELADTKRFYANGDSGMTLEFWMQSSLKYMIGILLIALAPQIIDSVVWLNGAIGHIINQVKLDGGDGQTTIPDITKKAHGWQKFVIGWLQTIAYMTMWVAQMLVKILIFMRFLQLYIAKAAMPIFVAAYVSEDYKSVAVGYIKQVIAIILQGFALLLILKLWPVLINSTIFEVTATGSVLKNISGMFMPIAQGIVIIFTLLGSQNLVRRWMGV
ncbi:MULTISPECIES: hypothetical protein [Leuconostoc]|uniref:Tn5252, Orf23 n=1 Tax=Leuconostoc inhae TaxID=178001 RepID=A0AAN2QU27_9LACO|nr:MULTISPECIES: hypothetical protein [Leuconostoc]MBZ5947836.1 hypothetical protein [Leuconostoc gasicomitatum]MBZ5955676.1 hypothetical protein [Leuconostoc gasicomitatum]MBZ5960706.1 hypothetical protein [Leuconostoc gasicomitatum]MBZ5979914.1 hypothetical protein [Leuconostoc gasicomitatum]MBZ5983290.1 hypothetical protein [Leuconostoc gasicomitatum]